MINGVSATRTRRYTDCQSFEELAQMLEENDFRQGTYSIVQNFPYANFPLKVRGVPYLGQRTVNLRIGSMAQLVDGQSCWRADQETPVEATGIIVGNTGNNNFVWAPEALIWCSVTGTATRTIHEVFLGQGGTITFTVPETGWVQRVGHTVAYDRTTNNYLVFIRCDIGQTF